MRCTSPNSTSEQITQLRNYKLHNYKSPMSLTRVDSPDQPGGYSFEPPTTPVPPRRIALPVPWVTRVLVGLNVLVFVAMIATGGSTAGFTNYFVLKWGANYGPLSLGRQPWRMLASNYVHGNLLHIALNMWCLWNLGTLAEFIFGRWTLLWVYTFCGLAGSLASLWWHPNVIGVGASGAIFGLAGAMIAAIYLGKLPYPRQAFGGVLRSLLAFAGYNLLFGAAISVVDNSAHIGGLLMGLLLGTVIGQYLHGSPDSRRSMEWLTFAGAAILLIVLTGYVKKTSARQLEPELSRAIIFERATARV
jgi:rhomboid protease GluP